LSKGGLLKGERCGFTSFDKLRTNGLLLARSVNWKMKDAKPGILQKGQKVVYTSDSPFALSLSKGYLLKGERCGFTSFDKLRTNGPLLAKSVNWKMKDAENRTKKPLERLIVEQT